MFARPRSATAAFPASSRRAATMTWMSRDSLRPLAISFPILRLIGGCWRGLSLGGGDIVFCEVEALQGGEGVIQPTNAMRSP